jgi:CysZ protein
VPVAVNVIIFFILTSMLVANFSLAVANIVGLLPEWEWLQPLINAVAGIIWVLAALIAVVVYGYSFTIITNIIAAPFYGFLAEKVELHLSGEAPPSEPLTSMIVRTFGRELVKLWYFISRGILVFLLTFILGFIPLANFFVPVIVMLWAAWSMSIQYVDYAADNHRTPFKLFRSSLGQCRYSAWGFGGLTMLGAMIPIVNIFVPPAAVAGGAKFWLHELKHQPEVTDHRRTAY